MLAILIVLGALQSSSTDSLFYRSLFETGTKPGYFVSLNVKSPSYTGRAIIDVTSLTYFVLRSKGRSYDETLGTLVHILVKDSTLDLWQERMELWGFREVKRVPAIDRCERADVDSLVTRYFSPDRAFTNGYSMKSSIPDTLRAAVINKLFQLGFPTYTDGYTGKVVLVPADSGK
jgi:hypothetical protein